MYKTNKNLESIMSKKGITDIEQFVIKACSFLIDNNLHELIPFSMVQLNGENTLKTMQDAQRGGAVYGLGAFNIRAAYFIREDDDSIYSLENDELAIWYGQVIWQYELIEKFIAYNC